MLFGRPNLVHVIKRPSITTGTMNVLFLTQIIPYPPDAGPKVKTWHVLRYLHEQGHRVTLVSFIRSEEEKHVDALKALCAEIYTVPIHRSRLTDIGFWLRSQLRGSPFLVERDALSAMKELIIQLTTTKRIDVIHADQLTMAQFALLAKPEINKTGPSRPAVKRAANGVPAIVFDAHNAVWTIVERMRQNAAWYLRPVLALEARRIKRYEAEIIQRFDHNLAVTEIDRAALLQAIAQVNPQLTSNRSARTTLQAHPKISVIPIAVDTKEQLPVSRSADTSNILTLGTLHYPPNADGVRWFAQDVLPLIRRQVATVGLTIVGKNPPPDIQRLAAAQPGHIKVTGYVPDLTPYMESAALIVVPVRAGGGMRVRILEAFARGMPVVTTTVGLEGIDAQPGRDVFVADAPEEFASAVVKLLREPSLRDQLAANGRALVEKKYDWQVVLTELDNVYANFETRRAG